MEDIELSKLCSANKTNIALFLHQFLSKHEKSRAFLLLDTTREIIWANLIRLIDTESFEEIHHPCLQALRILSRDSTHLDEIVTPHMLNILFQKASLTMEADNIPNTIRSEALKCLCNICYNSQKARYIIGNIPTIAEIMNNKIERYESVSFTTDIPLFEMKLLFILTAFLPDLRTNVLDMRGVEIMCTALNQIFNNKQGIQDVTENQLLVACEILKILFNLLSFSKLTETEVFNFMVPVLRKILLYRCWNEAITFDLHNNTSNLLTSVPEEYYRLLTPELDQEQMEGDRKYHFEGRNCEALDQLIKLLHYRLNHITSTDEKHMLMPILSLLIRAARCDPVQRKYIRSKILPPLREVHRRPETGDLLRNKMCRLLTDVDTQVRDLAAELLFILCKQNVNRMIKYTGFGNAAGLLAQKGLMCVQSREESSTDEDSDTEEYLEAKPDIDPVVGCTRPHISNPFQGMSEEQKEYEAMKLVNLMDKLVSSGTVRPARIGPDGRPVPIEHVLQLREEQDN